MKYVVHSLILQQLCSLPLNGIYSLLVDLSHTYTHTHTHTMYRANSSIIVSGAIELLVHACSSQDRAISLAGQENLHKLIKVRVITLGSNTIHTCILL